MYVNVRFRRNGPQHDCETLYASARHPLNSARIRSLTSYAKLSWSPSAGRIQANSSISAVCCQYLRRGAEEYRGARLPREPGYSCLESECKRRPKAPLIGCR